jgi:hypothetical protein
VRAFGFKDEGRHCGGQRIGVVPSTTDETTSIPLLAS